MTAELTHVIVGASLAGATAAATLRAEGASGPIVLLGAELEEPYERPPLSKQLLRGESAPEDARVHPPSFYDEHDIDLRLGTRAIAIDPADRVVQLDDGHHLRYDRLLLATGARARRLRVPGADLDGVFTLRTLADNQALRDELAAGPRRVAVVGGGWIGSEVAASLRQLGHDVALVAPGSAPLDTVLGPEVGAVYRDLHAAHGVELHLGERAEGFVGSDGTVTGVRTAGGDVVEADLVVVGVGAEPRVELAAEAGLEVDDGIVVDDCLRTSAPDVFAAGDVAAAWHPALRTRLRVEHWANAKNQGVAAARNMLGADEAYERVPYFFSDQYDLGMEYSGHAPRWDRVVFRGDPASGAFLAFWIADGRVAAAMNANIWDVTPALQALVTSGRRVDPDELADPDRAVDRLAA